jgi:putative ABC transport system permease protein
MEHLWRDIRYSVRRLISARWFTVAAVITLGLGIGANTSVFTFVNAVLIRGLPFDDPERIVAVWTENERGQESGVSYPDYLDWREQVPSFESLSAYLGSNVNVSESDRVPEQIAGAYVSANFFEVIGQKPALGRAFASSDDQVGSEPVVLLGHSTWQNSYGADASIIGRTIRVNGLVATIIGIMPEGMRFPDDTEVWIPRTNLPPGSEVDNRGSRGFNVVGRLMPGIALERAREELGIVGARLADEYPATNEGRSPDLMAFQDQVNGPEIRMIFLALMGAVAFVLLIACANVANLMLAKAAQRSREMAVRVSIGATRGRLVRQLLIESLILAFLAGVLGLGLAYFGIRWFDANTQDVGKPYWMEFSMDGVVFLYTLAVCFATVLLSGLAPAMHVSKTDVSEVLKEGGRGGSAGFRTRRWGGFLVVTQLVLTLVLLSGAGFMMHSFMKLYRMNVGFDTSRLLTMRIYLPLTQYPEAGPQLRLFENLEDRLAEAPSIEASALTTSTPLGGGAILPIEIEGSDAVSEELRPTVTSVTVGAGYFGATGSQLLNGRAFERGDGLPGSEVAVVNQRFADLHLGGDPMGRRIRVTGTGSDDAEPEWLTVIGITPNIRQAAVEDIEPDPVVYRPIQANPARGMVLLVRTRADPEAAASVVREALSVIDPDLPLFEIRTMDELLAQERWPFRTFGLMFSVFAVIALVLSAIGLYSVTAHAVIQRTHEFGIRMSLGAEPRQISWLALRRVLIHLAIGLPLGILGALGVGQLLSSLLVQMTPTDPITLVTIVIVLLGVAVLACIWPARRAARLDPAIALRVE